MADEPDADTTRRRVLLGVGTGLTVGLAGCGGTGGDATPTDAETDAPMETATETAMETPTETDTGTETEAPGGTASVRVAHVSPNAPNVDVYVDDSAVLEDVPFGTVSDYLDVPAGDRQVEITPAGSPDAAVFSGTVSVDADAAYTVAAIGEVGETVDQPFEPLIVDEETDAPADDMARVRLVHASPDAPAVDVTVESSGDTLFDGVPYGETGMVTVPAGEYTLQIRGDTEDDDGDVVASFDVNLDGGAAYTAFAAGYLTPDDEPADTAFDLLVAQDAGGTSE